MECKETEYGFEISWDPDDPVESIFNTWTEEDFTKVIMDKCREILGEENV